MKAQCSVHYASAYCRLAFSYNRDRYNLSSLLMIPTLFGKVRDNVRERESIFTLLQRSVPLLILATVCSGYEGKPWGKDIPPSLKKDLYCSVKELVHPRLHTLSARIRVQKNQFCLSFNTWSLKGRPALVALSH
jgi:hypothetical protein